MSLIRRLFDRLLRLFGLGGRPVPQESVSVRPIAVVRNSAFDPRPDGWDDLRSDLIFRDDLLDALDGIEAYSHVIVVFAFHQVSGQERTYGKIALPGEATPAEQGVLATRSQRRPSALGIAVVRLVRRRKNILRVVGLDAIDGTPVLDIKPYLPSHDSVPDATQPDWMSGVGPGAAGDAQPPR